MKKHIVPILLAIMSCISPALHAQQADEVEYTKEIGGGVGLGFMLGETNNKWFSGLTPNANVQLRFILSPRMAIRTELGYNRLKGDNTSIRDFHPYSSGNATTERLNYSMSGSMLNLNVLYELHFLPYGWYRNYLGHKRVTPYIQLGLGLAYAHTSTLRNAEKGKCDAVTVDIPLGLGLKYKVARRLNLGIDWTFHFTPSDKLDGLTNPSGVKTSAFHGKDFYSQARLTLTYDISPKCPTCNKAD